MIDKTAFNAENLARPHRSFANARSAFRSLLAALDFEREETVLLPAYIGWSPREGSGVFDPIAELGLQCGFYRMDERLHIDVDHVESCLKLGRVKAMVLIHYFGYVDPQYRQIVQLARDYGAWIVEDEAHALFSDLVGGACGRSGDACIYSLHKMLPMRGGMLTVPAQHARLLEKVGPGEDGIAAPWGYDLFEIARRRRHNAQRLAGLLVPLADDVTLLRESPAEGEVPQTLPVLVERVSRDDVYHALNAAGFGAVSLYHTLIPKILREAFPDSHRLARTILNLPVHQDVRDEDLDALVWALRKLLHGESSARPHSQASQRSTV